MGGILTGCKRERISNYNLNKGKTTEMVMGRVLGEVREKPHVLRQNGVVVKNRPSESRRRLGSRPNSCVPSMGLFENLISSMGKVEAQDLPLVLPQQWLHLTAMVMGK